MMYDSHSGSDLNVANLCDNERILSRATAKHMKLKLCMIWGISSRKSEKCSHISAWHGNSEVETEIEHGTFLLCCFQFPVCLMKSALLYFQLNTHWCIDRICKAMQLTLGTPRISLSFRITILCSYVQY